LAGAMMMRACCAQGAGSFRASRRTEQRTEGREMPIKIVAGIVAVTLMIAFLVPVVLKLKDISLGVVILIGLGLMLVDLWQSLQSKDD
jgi:Flp pilus assembly protein TadB